MFLKSSTDFVASCAPSTSLADITAIEECIYISYVHDCGDNPDGFYCETYSDPNGDHKIDDFVIRPTDIYDFGELSYPRIIKELTRIIQHYYDDVVLNLDYDF